MRKINDFDIQIQSDEIGAYNGGGDWINDYEIEEEDEDFLEE